MIDFRYHLVSLIAVFLAVALGIVIGTTQLNGVTLDNLQGQVTSLQKDKRALEDQTQGLQGQLDKVGGFEEAVGPTLVKNTLTGRRVVLVVGNGDVPADVVEGVTALLGAAGATVTGSIRLTDAFSDPAGADGMQSYLTGPGVPAGITVPTSDDAGSLVAAVLAQVLMVPGVGDPGYGTTPDQTAAASVLAGLEQLKVLSKDTTSVSPADFAVFLATGAYTGKDADARNATLLKLVAALDAQGTGAIVAGDATTLDDGGLVAAVRGDATIDLAVSTIDDVDTAAGRVSTVLAVGAEGRGQPAGAYGVGQDTQPVPPAAS